MDLTTNPAPGLTSLAAADLAPTNEYSWVKTYSNASSAGSFTGEKMTVGGTGNVYTAGRLIGTADFDPGAGTENLTSFNQTVGDGCIGKLKQDGTFAWAKQFQGLSYQDGTGATRNDSSAIITSIAVDSNGNTYTTGQLTGVVDFDPNDGVVTLDGRNGGRFVTKLDAGGNFVWAKQLNVNTAAGESADANLVADQNGNIYLTGGYTGTLDLDPNGGTINVSGGGTFATKWSTDGNAQWGVQVAANILPTAGITIADGGITYIAGSGANGASSITKVNADGAIAWNRQYNFGVNDALQGLDVDAAGNVYAIGYFVNTVDFDPNAGVFNLSVPSRGTVFDTEIFVTKLNADGSFGWARQIPTRYDGAVNGLRNGSLKIDVSDAGNAYVSGVSESPFLSKLNTNGNFVWTKELPTLPTDLGFDPAGNILTIGLLNGTVDFDLSEVGSALTTGTNSTYALQLKDVAGFRTPDLLLRNSQTGAIKVWDLTLSNRQNQETVVRYGSGYGAQAGQAVIFGTDWQLATTGDFNNDGISDFVWQNQAASLVVVWYMGNNGVLNNADFLKFGGQYLTVAKDWVIGASADINGDGNLDLIVRNSKVDASGAWLMNGRDNNLAGLVTVNDAAGNLVRTGSANVEIAGVGDFDKDGKIDIVHRWQGSNLTAIWKMDRTTFSGARFIFGLNTTETPRTDYEISAIGDFNGDGAADIVFRNQALARTLLWTETNIGGNYGAFSQTELPGLGTTWRIGGSGDFNRDGTADLILREPVSDQVLLWAMKDSAVQPIAPGGTDFIKNVQNVIVKPGGAAWEVEAIGQLVY
jgi:FG-GAP-like repeat/Beta-propeller repeat